MTLQSKTSIALNLSQLQSLLFKGNTTCIQLVTDFLEKISESDLNAFIEIFDDEALQAAAEIDEKITRKTQGKLAGLVVSLKDNICYKDHISSAGSKILENHKSIYSATVVNRLLSEDAIIIGRTNCDEFGMGSSNENSAYGPVKNFLDPSRVSGGSSGGAAVSVQAGLCHAAIGSDTGGSIRQPASFCGLVGLKPTYGRISRYGLIAYGSSLDQIGVIGNYIEDVATILEVIAGKDENDHTSSIEQVEAYSSNLKSTEKFKIATIKNFTKHESLDESIHKQIDEQIVKLKDQGHTVKEVDFDLDEYLIPAYYILAMAEASSNLARYDGVHYGLRADEHESLTDMYIKTRSAGFGNEVKNRIIMGNFVLSSGYYDAYVSKAQKVRRLLKNFVDSVFKEFDFIMIPSSATSAFKLAEKLDDPVSMYLSDLYTVLANLVGCCAISLPVMQAKNGMPIGLQFLAANFNESNLLKFSYEIMNQNVQKTQ